MSNVNFNSVRAGNQANAKQATGQLNVQELGKLIDSLPIEDQINLKGGAAENADLPPVFQQLSARDQQTLLALPASVRQKVLTDGVPNQVDAAKFQISQNLVKLTQSLVPGEGLNFEPPQAWRVSDAAIAYNVVNNLSFEDRKRIAGTTFTRTHESTIQDAASTRQSDGKADLNMEQGHGFFGHLGVSMANLFERWALTAPLGLILRDWFPHATENYHTRTIEIGDAQASRMQEVMTHEIGHQVEFGPGAQPDLGLMSEWAKLSGWKDASGQLAPGVGVGGETPASGLAASIRPTRTDNFVYEDFTRDLDPKKVQEAAAQIADPELRGEFVQTAKIKKNLAAAIKEQFGVDCKGYSMASPMEDFAESYRAFYLDPDLLLRKAPDKFLFLNSVSKKYSPDQVKAYFDRNEQNPQQVATQLASSGLKQDTIDRIFKANGLSANVETLGTAAAKALDAGPQLPPVTQAFLQLQQKVSSGDLTYVNSFTKDPSKALGDVWSKLSPAEQAQFDSEAKRTSLVQGMQKGQISGVAMANQMLSDASKTSLQDFTQRLIKDGSLRDKLKNDPQAVLSDPAFQNFPPALQAKFQDPKFRANFSKFAGHLDKVLKDASRIPFFGDNLVGHLAGQISNWDDVTLSGAMELVSRNPQSAADVMTGRKSAVEELGPGGGG